MKLISFLTVCNVNKNVLIRATTKMSHYFYSILQKQTQYCASRNFLWPIVLATLAHEQPESFISCNCDRLFICLLTFGVSFTLQAVCAMVRDFTWQPNHFEVCHMPSDIWCIIHITVCAMVRNFTWQLNHFEVCHMPSDS